MSVPQYLPWSRCRNLLESDDMALLVLDPEQGHIHGSSRLTRALLDRSATDLESRSLAEFGAWQDPATNLSTVSKLCADGHLRRGDLPLISLDRLQLEFAFITLGSLPNGHLLLEARLHNIHAARNPTAMSTERPEPRPAASAYRRQFLAAAERECERSIRYHSVLSVVCLELEREHVGDASSGRRVADLCLAHLSQRCAESLRGSDLAGRTGTGEWLLLLPEVDHHGARQAALRLQRRLSAEPVPVKTGGRRKLGLRFGVASDEGLHADLPQLHARARDKLQPLTAARFMSPDSP